MTGEYIRAIYAVGNPPCVELCCPYCSLCSREALVCVSFRDWTNNGVVKPKKERTPDMTKADWRRRSIAHESYQRATLRELA
jgi:hypothetical protein